MTDIVCGFDIETTGLEISKNDITEVSWVIKEAGVQRPMIAKSFYIYEDYYDDLYKGKDNEGLKITQIDFKKHLKQLGVPLTPVVKSLVNDIKKTKAKYMVAHNGENFDKPFLEFSCAKLSINDAAPIFAMDWIDTMVDLPSESTSGKLSYMAADLGFLNPFPHMALLDVSTMLKVLDFYDFEKIAERSKYPWLTLRAMVSFGEKELAKARKFRWETVGGKHYPKCWVKRVKSCDYDEEVRSAPFDIKRVD